MTKEDWDFALHTLVDEKGRRMLDFLYNSEKNTMTSPQLSEVLGLRGETAVNSRMGNLGKKIARHFGIKPEMWTPVEPNWWNIVAKGKRSSNGYLWTMRKELVSAMKNRNKASVKKILSKKEILESFLRRWPIETVREMTLNEYVGIKNPDTFCQWVETKTRILGSIKGISSIKFGIYKREKANLKPKQFLGDSEYSWQHYFSGDRYEVFENVKKEVLLTIKYAMEGNLNAIEHVHLTDLYKWKIAYLYSNERLIPIFSKEVLNKIVRSFGLNATQKTPISEMQEVIINKKPPHIDIHQFAEVLWQEFGEVQSVPTTSHSNSDRRHLRKASGKKNMTPQVRSGSGSYVATQKHNILQEALISKLKKQYGDQAVSSEENWVDIKLLLPNTITFYEVKSASYASDCIKEALGQVLSYAFKDSDSREKKITVVGQYPPNEYEKDYINYLKESLTLNFDYEFISINE